MNFIIQFVIALVLAVISYILAPKPKTPKPEAAKDMENPTAEAGMPIPVVFGTVTLKSPNCLWFGEKRISTYKVPA